MANRSILVAGALAALAAGGCAYQPPEIAPAPAGAAPLEAYLYTEPGRSGGLMFDVSRAAYVAIFEIYPGMGSAMVYPRPGQAVSSGASYAGLHQVRFDSRRGDFYSFLPAPAGYAGPRFYLLVASEEPLRLDRFGAYGSGLSQAMGVHFASMNAYSAMERLVSESVPNVESESWTTDFYVDWPVLSPSPRQGYVLVRCGDYSAYVPMEMVLAATQALCPSEQDETGEVPVSPTDSTATVKPIRRPPAEPVTERIASTQLERPEEWEFRRRAAASGRTVDADDLRNLDSPTTRERARDARGRLRENPAAGGAGAAGSGAADRGRPRFDDPPSIGPRARPGSPSSGPRAEPIGRAEPRVSPPSAAPADRPAVPRENPPATQ